jgi:hypothetical protein
MIFKIFSPNFSMKTIGVFDKAKLCKILIITLVFEKNANFFAEICQKSQKIVIITSTPDESLSHTKFISQFFGENSFKIITYLGPWNGKFYSYRSIPSKPCIIVTLNHYLLCIATQFIGLFRKIK